MKHFLRAGIVSNAENYVLFVACRNVMSLGHKECLKVDLCVKFCRFYLLVLLFIVNMCDLFKTLQIKIHFFI